MVIMRRNNEWEFEIPYQEFTQEPFMGKQLNLFLLY